jgi:hypothetical protein
LRLVIQIVVSAGLPRWWPLRSRCLANPDALLAIGESAGHASPAEELSDRFSLVLHDLRVGGTWKRTNRGRLKRTEEMLSQHTPAELKQGFTLLDVGASDGTTTVEVVRALRQAFAGDIHAVLADRDIGLSRYRHGPVVEYRATDGEPIMVRLGPFGVRLAKQRRDAEPQSNALARRYLQCHRFRRSMRLDARISLVNPVAHREPGITILQFDCLIRNETLADSISAIRASNVLNLGYFNPSQIHTATGHFHSYLKNGGCLVVSSNAGQPEGETENGSVWRKDDQRFRWIEDFGIGSEIKSLIDGWSLCRPPGV